MADSLKLTQTSNGNQTIIKLEGQIDEDANYSTVTFGGFISVTFDMEGITLINSSGIQRWVNFIRGIPETIKLYLTSVPPRIINQINLFPGFLDNRQVGIISFFAPYYCEACDKTHNIKMDTAVSFPDREAITPPPANCPQCQKQMDFDGIPKKYFTFLSR
jgi:anti-anti-sigma regulatory factor